MHLVDWFWAGVMATLGWIAAPFILIALALALIVLWLMLYMTWAWFKDFCKTAIEFYGSLFR